MVGVHRLVALVRDGEGGQLCQKLGKGEEEQGGDHVEESVEVGDVAAVHHTLPERQAHRVFYAVEHHHENKGADEVEVEMYKSRPLGPLGRADGGDERGGAGADVLAQDDGMALPQVTTPVVESACKMPTEAEELWMAMVTSAPAIMPRIGFSRLANSLRKSGCLSAAPPRIPW